MVKSTSTLVKCPYHREFRQNTAVIQPSASLLVQQNR